MQYSNITTNVNSSLTYTMSSFWKMYNAQVKEQRHSTFSILPKKIYMYIHTWLCLCSCRSITSCIVIQQTFLSNKQVLVSIKLPYTHGHNNFYLLTKHVFKNLNEVVWGSMPGSRNPIVQLVWLIIWAFHPRVVL